MENLKRNDLCSCGSNKKFKHCCLKKTEEEKSKYLTMDRDSDWKNLRIAEDEIYSHLKDFLLEKIQDEKELAVFFDFSSHEFIFSYENATSKDDDYRDIYEYWLFFDYKIDLESYLFPQKKKKIKEITIAEACLNEKPQIFTEFQKKMIQTIINSPYSFHLIENVVDNRRIFLTDILFQKQMEIKESKGTLYLKKGLIICAKVITIDNQSIFFGIYPRVIPNNFYPEIVEFRNDFKTKKAKKNLQDEFILRDLYFSFIEEANIPLTFVNSDNEPISLHDISYDLKCCCLEAFNKLSSLNPNDEIDLLKEGEYEKNRLTKIQFSWIKKDGSKKVNNNHLGEISISKNKLNIFVNSDNRADIIKEEISKGLGSDAILKEDKITDPASIKEQEEEPKKTPITPEIKNLFKTMQSEYYKEWLDQKLPYLGNITPRQAAKNNEGKEKLKALLLEFEQTNDYHKENDDHHMVIDIASIKSELKL